MKKCGMVVDGTQQYYHYYYGSTGGWNITIVAE